MNSADAALEEADLERRFGGLRRLHGDVGYARLRQARVAVVGVGGVGSWAVEALARCGVAALVLIDLDHVSESNINRQIQALDSTLGQAKTQALRERIAHIHPGCAVTTVEDFVQPDNWPALLPHPVDVLIDACDQGVAKLSLAIWSLHSGVPVVSVGAAGGKQRAEEVQVADLADVTHDPLLASLRQRLRKTLHADLTPDMSLTPFATPARRERRPAAWGLACVFSRENVHAPAKAPDAADAAAGAPADGSLNCHGYGSSVTVTATFGMVAAGVAVRLLLAQARASGR